MRKELSIPELRSRGDDEADPELPANTGEDGEADEESEVQNSDPGGDGFTLEVDESGVEVATPPTAP